ncbi:MAG: tripartite tricarboxylate transporter permease [Hyphomicrobiales bacterium]
MAAHALSAAFASCLFGGLVGAAFLTLFILVAQPVVLLFKSPELLMISVFGWSTVSILAGRLAIMSIVASGLGLHVGTIREGPSNGEQRISSYDFPYLTNGLKLVIVGFGIFAVPEIVNLMRTDKSISERSSLRSNGQTASKTGEPTFGLRLDAP